MAHVILLVAASYAAIGVLFGLLFVWRGIERVDAAAYGASWAFRILILPGVAALWPLLATRWRRAIRSRSEA